MSLIAELTDGKWTVRDTDGGRWWPNDAAAEEIDLADDPKQAAVAMCEAHPMTGEWRD